MNDHGLEREILEFIQLRLLRGPAQELSTTTSLFDLGVVDSLNMIALLAFLEARTGVAIPLEEIHPDDVQDVEHLASMVRRRQ